MDSSKIILLLGISFLCWLIYKSVLADHKLFVFNRFFLLGTVVISLAIPFIQIDIARENNPVTRTVNLYYIQEVIIGKAPQPSFNWYKIVAYGYIVITVFLLFALYWAYFKLLTGFIKQKKTVDNIHYILLDNKQIPYCFLNYIFVPGEDFLHKTSNLKYYSMSRLIFSEAYIRHYVYSAGFGFCMVQSFFWLIKQSITANHEFLADEHTLRLSKDIQHYRKLIISKQWRHIITSLQVILIFTH